MAYLRYGDSLKILRDISPDDNNQLMESLLKCDMIIRGLQYIFTDQQQNHLM